MKHPSVKASRKTKNPLEPFTQNNEYQFRKTNRVVGTTLSSYTFNEVGIFDNKGNVRSENGFMSFDVVLGKHSIFKAIITLNP